jgi:hypothetical protein
MNKKSSRSHAILQILVEQKWIETDNNDPSLILIKKVKNKIRKIRIFLIFNYYYIIF